MSLHYDDALDLGQDTIVIKCIHYFIILICLLLTIVKIKWNMA